MIRQARTIRHARKVFYAEERDQVNRRQSKQKAGRENF